MKKIKIQLLHDNGKQFDEAMIHVFLFQPRLIKIDDKFYVQECEGSTRYRHSEPDIYKTSQPTQS